MNASNKRRTLIIILLGIALVFGIGGFYFKKYEIPQYPTLEEQPIESTRTESPQPTNQRLPAWESSPDLKFIFGYVLDKGDTQLAVQQVLLTGNYGANVFLIRTSEHTTYKYILPDDIKKATKGSPPQGVDGSFEGIKEKMFVSVAVRGPIMSIPRIIAESISYSEISPISIQSSDGKKP